MVLIEELPAGSCSVTAGPSHHLPPAPPPQQAVPPAAPDDDDVTPHHHRLLPAAQVEPPADALLAARAVVPAAPDTPWVVAPPPAAPRHPAARAPLVVININTPSEHHQGLHARDWKFIASSFATLALVYMATGLVSLASAFFLDVPDSNKSRIVTWVFYGVGAGLPWLVTAVLKIFRNREGIQAVLPYLCFATNTISVLAFSTRLLGLVSIRGAILMPIMLASLAAFSVFAQLMTYNVEFIRLALFACSAIGGIGTADKLLNSKFPALRSEADLVAKAAYIQVTILRLCHCYDAIYGDDHQGRVGETVRNWYIYDTIGNRRVVSATLSTVIGTIWVVYTSS